MNTRHHLAALFLALGSAATPVLATADCCAAPAAPATPTTSASVAAAGATAPAGHPLRGVIVAVLPEKSALLVKHEEIPGVMSAMTMLLKVDATTLAAAKKDTAIIATLVKKTDGWWLEDVSAAPAPTPPKTE